MPKILNEDDAVKGQLKPEGIPVYFEFRPGDTQTGVNKQTGESWERDFYAYYGYIPGKEGTDGDSLDAFVRPKTANGKHVYVIHNLTPDGLKFDEDKVMLGFDNKEQAHMVWKKHMHEPEKMFGGISQFTADEFKEILKKVSKTNKGIIADSEVYYSLKNKGLLSENLPSLAFNVYLISDDGSHFIPSTRYPDQDMGRFRQYTGTPLSSEMDKFEPSVQTRIPSEEMSTPDNHANKTHGYEDKVNLGDYGQNQSYPLDSDNPYIPDINVNKPEEIPIDDHKMDELKFGKPFDYDVLDAEYVVNMEDDIIDQQKDKVSDFIIDILKSRKVSPYFTNGILPEVISIINDEEDAIYLNFGKSLTEKEKREIISRTLKKYTGVKDEVFRSSR